MHVSCAARIGTTYFKLCCVVWFCVQCVHVSVVCIYVSCVCVCDLHTKKLAHLAQFKSISFQERPGTVLWGRSGVGGKWAGEDSVQKDTRRR